MRIVIETTEYEVGPLLAGMVELLCRAPELERSEEGSCSFNWYQHHLKFEVRTMRAQRTLPQAKKPTRSYN